jgi:hypothetical protein
MTLQELKQSIQQKTLTDTFYVFVCPENTYLANQYIDAICEVKQLSKQVVESIFAQESALSLVMGFENDFRVVYVDTFSEAAADYSTFVNTAVVCSSIDKKLEKFVADYIIQMPTLTDWQIKSFIKTKCAALTDQVIDELYKATRGNIYLIDDAIYQAKLFPEELQNKIVYQFTQRPDLQTEEIATYKVASQLVSGDKAQLLAFLKQHDMSGSDFLMYANAAVTELRKLLFVQNTTCTEEALELTSKQYYAIKNLPRQSQDSLHQKLAFLSALDLRLKSGLLDMKNANQIDYLIVRLLS